MVISKMKRAESALAVLREDPLPQESFRVEAPLTNKSAPDMYLLMVPEDDVVDGELANIGQFSIGTKEEIDKQFNELIEEANGAPIIYLARITRVAKASYNVNDLGDHDGEVH